MGRRKKNGVKKAGICYYNSGKAGERDRKMRPFPPSPCMYIFSFHPFLHFYIRLPIPSHGSCYFLEIKMRRRLLLSSGGTIQERETYYTKREI